MEKKEIKTIEAVQIKKLISIPFKGADKVNDAAVRVYFYDEGSPIFKSTKLGDLRADKDGFYFDSEISMHDKNYDLRSPYKKQILCTGKIKAEEPKQDAKDKKEIHNK